jgi:hypothetical protein
MILNAAIEPWCPVLNLAQYSFYILGHGELAQSAISDRNRVWRDVVGEISPVAASPATLRLKQISLRISGN